MLLTTCTYRANFVYFNKYIVHTNKYGRVQNSKDYFVGVSHLIDDKKLWCWNVDGRVKTKPMNVGILIMPFYLPFFWMTFWQWYFIRFVPILFFIHINFFSLSLRRYARQRTERWAIFQHKFCNMIIQEHRLWQRPLSLHLYIYMWHLNPNSNASNVSLLDVSAIVSISSIPIVHISHTKFL